MKEKPLNNSALLLIGVLAGVITYFLSAGMFIVYGYSLALFIIYRNTPDKDRSFVIKLLIFGFLIRVAIALYLHAASYMQGYGGSTSGDDLLYTARSLALVNEWEGKPFIWIRSMAPSPNYGLNPFTYLLAMFYKVFGFHPAASKLINCALGSITGWIAYLTARELFGSRAGKISMAIVIFYPSLIRWSIGNLKDTFMILLIMISYYFIFAACNRRIQLWKYSVLFMAVYVMSLFFQKFYFMLIISGLCLAAAFRVIDFIRSRRLRITIYSVISIIMVISGYLLLYADTSRIVGFLYRCEAQQAVIAKADYAGYYFYSDKLLEGMNRGIVLWNELINVVLKSVSYFMLSPFPWQMDSHTRLVAAPQMALWYCLLIFALFGFAKLIEKRRRESIIIAIFLIIGVTVNSIAEGNIGAAFRHRDIFTPFVIILASGMICQFAARKGK